MGLLETELWKFQDERGPSQQSWVSAQAQHQMEGSTWALEIIGQFAGLLSASLNITLMQTFLTLDYSVCQDPLAACQGP